MKTFQASDFLAFDELLTFLLSEVHFPVSMNCFDAQFAPEARPVPRFGEHQRILFEGMKGVSNLQIGFYPLDCIRSLFKNQWPDHFELEYEPLQENERKKYELNARMTYTVQVLGGCFTQFWDRAALVAQQKFGSDIARWSAEVNFARVIRNCFAHGNRVHFPNPAAAPVTWRSITYGPANNGRVVLYNDMALADFIVLIEDVCACLA